MASDFEHGYLCVFRRNFSQAEGLKKDHRTDDGYSPSTMRVINEL